MLREYNHWVLMAQANPTSLQLSIYDGMFGSSSIADLLLK